MSLRLISILILLGTMPVSSVYAQCGHNNYENGFCQTEGCTSYQQPNGTGTESNPYQIANAGNLYWFAEQVNGGNNTISAKLTDNITVNDGYTINDDGTVTKDDNIYTGTEGFPDDFKTWTPIGNSYYNSYIGTFDGNDKTISGLYYKDASQSYVGLFARTVGCTIQRLGVINSYFKGYEYVGGIVGYNDGKVSNCYNTASISGSDGTGGIVGLNEGTVSNCYNEASISGSVNVGGIVGTTNSGTVSNCYNTASISGSDNVGGIVGATNSGTVSNCYNEASISGSGNYDYDYVGGIVGYNKSLVSYCYNTGAINGNIKGGIAGFNTGKVLKCYYLESSDYTGIGGTNSVHGETVPKTFSEFQTGEVAYLLQGGQKTQVWGQNIDNEQEEQEYPVLSEARVYEKCGTNNYTNIYQDGHAYDDNGFCTKCSNAYEPATIVVDVYQIANAGNLYWFAALVNGCTGPKSDNYTSAANAKLMNDIIVNESVLNEQGLNQAAKSGFRSWTPIADEDSDDGIRYHGHFYGNDKTISGLYYDAYQSFVGLFGVTQGGCTIQDLGVIDSYFNAKSYVGGIVGMTYESNEVSTSITNCYSKSYISGNGNIGGIVGRNYGTVSNCYNEGSISGSSNHVGGIAGYNYSGGTVSNCYNEGSISGNSYVGGIAGYNYSGGTVSDSYNDGSVSGDSYWVGGIAGYNNGGTVSNCYNEASISGSDNVGGIVGTTNSGTVSNCYNTGSIKGGSEVGGIAGQNINGMFSNCYYLYGKATGAIDGADVENQAVVKTSDQFASGEVAYLLQNNANPAQTAQVWGQNIDNGEERQNYPVLSTARVYTTNCCGNDAYSNTENATYEEHSFDNGFCIRCDAYQAATQEDGVYQIANAGNLYWFANHVNSSTERNNTLAANAKLTADIVVNEDVLDENGALNTGFVSTFHEWTPIGNSSNNYSGTFDGDNHTISGLYYNDNNNTANYVGLFGYVNNGSVKNVGVIDSYFKAGRYVGAIVGRSITTEISNLTTEISNCYNTGICQGTNDVGGVVGNSSSTTITNCYNTGTVSSTNNCGGIVGPLLNSTITNCFNTGEVIAPNAQKKGAIAAYYVGDLAPASNCYYLKVDNGVNSGIFGIGGTDTDGPNTVAKNYTQFASGEVAYLLQGSQETQIWGQNIDNGQEVQAYPVLSDARVYKIVDGEETSYSNFMGGNVVWSYEDGVLTIHGSGSMIDFGAEETKPWEQYLPYINTVVVKAGITRIGDYAFSNVNSGTEIILYGTTAPTVGTSCFNANANVYIPDLGWSTTSWSPNPTTMPTYTSYNTSVGWYHTGQLVQEPSSADHVAINADMTVADGKSLSVKSFGYCSDDVRITIEDGGQLTCQQANGEVTVEKEIQSYSQEPRANSQSSTKWYTISSPLKESVYATSVTNLIDATATNYALYRYDEPSYTWQNYKDTEHDNNFTTLDAGRGYLYANANSTTLSFTGEINTESVEYKLTANGTTLSGIHLIGNPFTHDITYPNSNSNSNFTLNNAELATGYYVLSNHGSWNVETNYFGNEVKIKPGQGALIKASVTNPENEATLTITNAASSKGEQPRANSQQPMLSLNVSNGNYSDRAFVIFSEGVGLDKINHQNEEIPMLYIPMSDADYAIAMMDESVNEIPVGFESSSMGEFTISLRQENCEFEELYLLDKETGAKVNILEQDYTFMATSGDNAERFVLLMDNGQQTADNSNFAYISNNDIVIYDVEGNAHIDIYDVLGRRVYNNNGSDDVHIVTTDGYSAGVYVIRIMDENGLRTQKVVIE